MDTTQRIVLIQHRMLLAQIELEAMKAENARRNYMGESQAYSEDHFWRLLEKYDLDTITVHKELAHDY